jgi:tetratricopeptide (TPR) repeat protein
MRPGLSTMLMCSSFTLSFALFYFTTHNPLYLPLIFFNLAGIIHGFFEFREYYNKMPYITALTVVLMVMWVVVAIQFSSRVNMMMYYIETGVISILLIGIVLYSFRTWEKNLKSLEYYDNLLEIDPNDVKSLNNKGVELAVQFKIEKAMEYFDKVLKLDPGDATALYNKSILLKGKGKYQNSREYLDKALELDPGVEQVKKRGNLLLKN